jgi:hypothetical protein
MLSRPRCRGVSNQRLQTRGGERWPTMASSEMRRWPPAVQAANVPACEPLPRLLTAGRSILLPEEGRLSAWVSYGGESRGFALT